MPKQPTFDGMEYPDVRITLLGAALNTVGQRFELGQTVDFHIKGHVTMCGDEMLGEGERRRLVKIRCDLVEPS